MKLTLPILQSFWKSLWHPPPLFEKLVKKILNMVGWGLGGQSPVFPESLFLIPKFVLGGPRWKSKEIQTSRLFCVNFKLVLCQSYINFMQTASSLPNIHLGQKGLKLCHAVEGLFQYNTNSWSVNHAPLMYFLLPHKSGELNLIIWLIS